MFASPETKPNVNKIDCFLFRNETVVWAYIHITFT
jgi:hypothetical protein